MLSGEELYTAYASGDIFMMPSESETLGFVALEAMSSGVPVVAVAAGGLTDIITNPGVSGRVWRLGFAPRVYGFLEGVIHKIIRSLICFLVSG